MSSQSQPVAVDNLIKAIVRGGKVVIGYRRASKMLKLGRLKAVILAEGSPRSIASDIEYYARLGGVPLVIYKGSSMDLGSLLGKPFPVSVIGVVDPGNVNIDLLESMSANRG